MATIPKAKHNVDRDARAPNRSRARPAANMKMAAVTTDYAARVSGEAREKLFGRNAIRWYGLPR